MKRGLIILGVWLVCTFGGMGVGVVIVWSTAEPPYSMVPVHGRDLTGRSDECVIIRRDGRSLGVYCLTSEDF